MAGGKSTVSHRLIEGGAGGSAGALAVAGEIRPAFPFQWAGMMYYPGAGPMQPVDLSGREALVFQMTGDGRSYNAMLFSDPSVQGLPATLAIQAKPEWTPVPRSRSNF